MALRIALTYANGSCKQVPTSCMPILANIPLHIPLTTSSPTQAHSLQHKPAATGFNTCFTVQEAWLWQGYQLTLMKYDPSIVPEVPKLQQLPHIPWSFTGVTAPAGQQWLSFLTGTHYPNTLLSLTGAYPTDRLQVLLIYSPKTIHVVYISHHASTKLHHWSGTTKIKGPW